MCRAICGIACAGAAAGALYGYRALAPWAKGDWGGIAAAYLGLSVMGALWAAALALVPPAQGGRVRGAVYAVPAFGFLALYFLNHTADIAWNPLAFRGEWRSAPLMAAGIWAALAAGSFPSLAGYYQGIGWLYLPVYACIGESIWAIKLFYLALWTALAGAVAAVWRREYGREGLLSALCVISTLAYARAVERTCKWHVIAALLSAALFVLFSLISRRRSPLAWCLVAAALALGVAGYKGCIAYVPFVALVAAWGIPDASGVPPRERGRRWAAAVSAAALAAALVWLSLGFFGDRLWAEMRGVYFRGAAPGNLRYILASFPEVFFRRAGFAASWALVAGLGACAAEFRVSWVARFTAIGFLLMLAMLLALYPFYNLDEGNFIVVFALSASAYGVLAWARRVPGAALRAAAIVAFGACLAVQERSAYRHWFPLNGCLYMQRDSYDTQGIVALYDLNLREDPDRGVVFFPDPALLGEGGGFGAMVHQHVLCAREYAAWRNRLNYFSSLGALRGMAADALGGGPARRVTAYVSPNAGARRIGELTRGGACRVEEVVLFEKEWGVRIPVLRVVFERPAPPAKGGGATRRTDR